VNFGPVSPQLTKLICELLARHGKNWRIQPNISGYTGLIFTIFSPYESALHADDRSGRLISRVYFWDSVEMRSSSEIQFHAQRVKWPISLHYRPTSWNICQHFLIHGDRLPGVILSYPLFAVTQHWNDGHPCWGKCQSQSCIHRTWYLNTNLSIFQSLGMHCPDVKRLKIIVTRLSKCVAGVVGYIDRTGFQREM